MSISPAHLAAAAQVAATAHSGQVDAIGAPYIGHINRVTSMAERLRGLASPGTSPYLVQSMAVLHDTLEDSALTATDLEAAGIPELVIDGVILLTHAPHQPRIEYISRICEVPAVAVVKLADTYDNLVRLPRLEQLDTARARRLRDKYTVARKQLESALDLPAYSGVR